MNGQNLEIKYQRHFYADSICHFKGYIKRTIYYKCVGEAENIHEELTSNVLGMLRKGERLTMRNKVK